MSEPAVEPLTRRVWDGLPEAVQTADIDRGWPLLAYLSTILDPAGEMATVGEQIDYYPLDEGGDGTLSRLVDPDTADPAWLPWLAQVAGVRLDPALSTDAARDAVKYGSAGWQAGTKAGIAAAAKSALTGSRYVAVFSNYDETGPAGQWDVLLMTRTTETASGAAVLQAVIDKGAKPAGVVLHHITYTATWDQLEAAYPTWADREGLTWNQLEDTGAPTP